MIKLIIADLKLLIRNRQLLFWSLAFPLIFTVIFGFFFQKGTGAGTVGLVNQSDSKIANLLEEDLKNSDQFKINDVDSTDDLKDRLNRGNINVGVYIPPDFGKAETGAPTKITIFHDPGNAQSTSIVAGHLERNLSVTNYTLLRAKPIFTLELTKITANDYGYFDFVLVGLIGMALMNSSIQGIAISMAKYREDKILKRITTTPLAPWKFILAEVISRGALNFIQVLLILAIGVYAFDGTIYGNLAAVVALSMLGAVLFQLIGFAIAAYSKTTQAAEGMATAITIPMMFLAGVFFPTDQLPKWLSSIVGFLPLSPFLKMLRGVALENKSAFDNPANMALILIWIAAVLALTIFKFRLTDE